MANPAIFVELKRAAAALRARQTNPPSCPDSPGWTWHARVVTHEGPGGAGLLDGRRTRFHFTRTLDEPVAARLPGVPVRRWVDPSDGTTWSHPPNPTAPNADSVVGAVLRAWSMPDGSGVEADLRLVDGALHQELLAIAVRGSLWRDAAVSLSMLYRGQDGEPGPRGITTIRGRSFEALTIFAVDLVNRPPGCDGTCLLRFIGEGEGG